MATTLPTAAMTALQVGMDVSRRRSESDAVRKDVAAQAKQVRYAQVSEEQERRERLRRAIASERARMAARGLSPLTGSSAAIISGLVANAARETNRDKTLADMRIGRLNDRQESNSNRNLLVSELPRYRSAFSLLQRGVQQTSLLDL